MSIAGDTQARVPGFYSTPETILSPRKSGLAWQTAQTPGILSQPTAIGSSSIAIGSGTATGNNSVVIGSGSAGINGVAIGTGSAGNGSFAAAGGTASGVGSVSFGSNNTFNQSFTAIGGITYGPQSISIGAASEAGENSIAIGGTNANAKGTANARNIAIGNSINTGETGLPGRGANNYGIGNGVSFTFGSSYQTTDSIGIGNLIYMAPFSGPTAAYNNIIAIGNNITSVWANNAIAIGRGSSISRDATGGIALGHTASSGATNGIAIGVGATATAAYGISIGGPASAVSNGIAIGSLANNDFAGQMNICNARFANAGDIATSILALYIQTANDTITELALGSGTASTSPTNRITLTNFSTYIFDVDIVARSVGSGGAAAWNLKFAVNRNSNAASTTISSLSKTILYTVGTTTGWDVTATADTTNGRPNISVTGAAATTIRWVGNAKMTKVATAS